MTQHLTTDTIIDYIHGELSAPEDALTHAHLQTCAACREDYERETQISEALLAAIGGTDRELPPMIKARIWEVVRAERPSPLARLAGFLRPAIAIPAAAILVVITYFASPLSHPAPSGPTVDATYYLEQHAAEQLRNPLVERSVTTPILETSDSVGTSPVLGTATAAAAALDAVE
jgi:anti-sigma factor RsiW